MSDLFIEMHSVGRLVVAVMAEWNFKTILFRELLIGDSRKYVMYLYPLVRATYKAPSLLTDD